VNKKAIAILGAIFLLIVGTLGFLIYQRRQAASPAPTTIPESPTGEEFSDTDSQNQNPETNANPAASNSGALRLTNELVISPILYYQGDGITYINELGHLVKNELRVSSGNLVLENPKEVTIPRKLQITRILWPETGNNFITEYRSEGQRRWSLYNGETNTYTDLPANITSLAWMPSSDKIIYIWLDAGGTSTLNIAAPDNSSYQTIADIYENDDEISVSPDGQSVLFYRRDSQGITNAINVTTPDGKLFKSLVKQGYNYGVLWSPNSRKFLYGKRDPQTQQYDLYVYDLISGDTESVGVASTVEKARWDLDSQNIYVAVPIQGSSGSGLTEDTFYKINLVTGVKTEFKPEVSVDGQDLFLSLTGDKLFFKNEQDGNLYYLDISGLE
jgi:hypothetical protein